MSIKIIVAEDSSYQRKIITDMINSQENMEVVAIARNGLDTLEKVEKFDPDVLLLDLEMPKMSGLEAFEFLSEHYLLPTIILSSSDPRTLDFETQTILLGAVDYINKPGGKLKDELPKIEEQLIDKILIASKMNKNYTKFRDSFRNALLELKTSLEKSEKGSPIKKSLPAVERPIEIKRPNSSSTEKKSANIRVVIAEDSSFQRKIITGMISSQEGIEVVAVARNGREALEKVQEFNPDVLILDLIMPGMTGLEAFEFLSEHYPIPTIVFSSLDPKTLDSGVQALLLGAVDYIMKPGGEWNVELPKFKEQLIEKIILASRIKNNYTMRRESFQSALIDQKSQLKKIQIVKPTVKKAIEIETRGTSRVKSNVIVMGASVGGPRTLKAILKDIPKDFSTPILIVQHMNAFFMNQFAQTLNSTCKLTVKIPSNGEPIKPKTIYLAPGGKHMEVELKGGKPCLRTFVGEHVNFCMPAVDVLFFSAAEVYRNRVLGILLTGMGADGVNGLDKIRKKGGRTIAESKETCVLYGMPKIAAQRGVADLIVPNYEVKLHMIKHSKL